MAAGTAEDLTLQDETLCHCPLEGKGRCTLHPTLTAVSGLLHGKCWCTEMETVSLSKEEH